MDERLPNGWVETTLGDILPILYGKGLSEAIRDKDGKIPVYGSSGLVGYHNQALTTDETLILGRKGSVGSVYYSSVPCWPIDTTYFVERTTSINLKFFLHLLTSLQLVRLDKSTAIPGLSRDDYNDIKVKIPPYPEQHRIVAVIEQQFTRLESAVASLQSAKARVKQYRASLLRAAVEGELTKDWRAEYSTEETGEQLLARILVERRGHWEKEQLSKMREKPKDDKWRQAYKEPQGPDVEGLLTLPEGWCWATVEQVAQIQGGIQKQPSRAPRQNAYPYLRVANVLRGRLDLSVIEKMELFGNELETLHLKSGDLLIVEGNGSKTEIGRSALWNDEIENCVHQNHIIRVRLNHVLPKFIDFYWNSPEGNQRVMDVAASTTGLYTLSVSKISRLPVPLPPLAEQAQIVAEVEAKLSNIVQMEVTIGASLKRAEHERQSILHEAFAGRLVPQDPDDEPASVLLERIREERKKRKEMEDIVRVNRKGIQMESTKRRRAGNTSLYTALVEARHPISPDDLFKRAGLKTDEQPESVEVFYEELHTDVENALVAETRPDYDRVLLEALEPSAEVLERIAEEEAARQAQEAEQSGKTIDAPMLWNMEPPRELRTGGM